MTIIGLDSVEIEASHPLDGAMTFFLYEISRRSFEVERSQVVGKLFVARASRCGIKKKKNCSHQRSHRDCTIWNKFCHVS